MNRYAGVRSLVSPALGCHGVLLAGHRLPDVYVAVLEDHGGVAEDEVDGAIDVAVAVELLLGVDVECVLVALEAALVVDREV